MGLFYKPVRPCVLVLQNYEVPLRSQTFLHKILSIGRKGPQQEAEFGMDIGVRGDTGVRGNIGVRGDNGRNLIASLSFHGPCANVIHAIIQSYKDGGYKDTHILSWTDFKAVAPFMYC